MKRVLVLGAGGRDFHNFNTFFRDNTDYKVEAFTWAQIPGVEFKGYPKELAGELYEEDIPIYDEKQLPQLIKRFNIDQVFFCYSDVSHEYVGHMATVVNAAGADFVLKGPKGVQLDAKRPVISVCAVRTGCGKSGLTRYISSWLKEHSLDVVAIRHPMAYRDLLKQRAQRFASLDEVQECTIEEREEFEPLIRAGIPVYCGIDYQEVINMLGRDNPQFVIWDGGNNDFSFLRSDLKITVVDPLRWEDTERYYPGEMNLIDANVIVINKVNTSPDKNIEALEEIIAHRNPGAQVIHASSDVDQDIDFEEELRSKKVCVVEDGPTLTHGDMPFGIGCLVVSNYTDKKQIVDVIPAVGYNDEQLQELEDRINDSGADIILTTNQVDLPSILNIDKPVLQITYSNYFEDNKFDKILMEFVRKNVGV